MDRVNLLKIMNVLRQVPKAKRGRVYQGAQKYEYSFLY